MSPTVLAHRDGSEYTEHPSGLIVEYRDASHRYWLHQGDQPRTAVPSVTGVLKVLAKDSLIPWAEARGAEGAVRAVQAGELDPSLPDAAERAAGVVRVLGLGADAARDEGAGRGTAIHDALDVYLTTGKVPDIAAFPVQHRGYVQALCRWLLAARPAAVFTEMPVGSWENGFAGRLDLVADLPGRGVTVVDVKTNRQGRAYDESQLQCAAYVGALAECRPDLELPGGAVVLALGEAGEFEQVECEATFRDFLDVLRAHQAVGRLRRSRQARERAARKAAA